VPDIGVGALVAHPGLVLEPDLDWPAERAGGQGRGQQGAKFFQRSLPPRCLAGMARTGLQPGQALLMQPSAHRALVYFNVKPPGHLGLQINASPAHDLVLCWIGSGYHQGFQLRHPGGVQRARPAGAAARLQTFDPALPALACVTAKLRRRMIRSRDLDCRSRPAPR